MDIHSQLLEELCRLCGQQATPGATAKSTLSKDIERSLGVSFAEDVGGVHPTIVCGSCRMKLSRWKKRKAKQRQSEPVAPLINLFNFQPHCEDCKICDGHHWDVDRLLNYFRALGYVSWKRGVKLYAVIHDDEGRLILKRLTVEGRNVETEIMGKPVHLSATSPQDIAEELLAVSICKGNVDFTALAEQHEKKGFKNIQGVPVSHVEQFHVEGSTVIHEKTIRHVHCTYIARPEQSSRSGLYLCPVCEKYRTNLHLMDKRCRAGKAGTSKNVPKVFLGVEDLQREAADARTEKKRLKQQNIRLQNKLKKMLETEGVRLDDQQQEEMEAALKASSTEIDKAFSNNSFVNLLWKQQKQAFSNKSLKQMRWHPSIVKWAIAIHTKSPAAYNTLRSSGFMTLPHPNTLFRYTHFTDPKTGINPDLLMFYYKQFGIEKLKQHEKMVNLILDEMKVKSGLFFSKASGKLIGFVETVNLASEMDSFERRCTEGTDDDRELASHVLLFMVRSVTSAMKFPLAYYATSNASGSQLYQTTLECMKAVTAMDLTVLCITSDGASPNRKLYEAIAGQAMQQPNFKGPNCFEENTDVYLICDVPHLLKTIRNNFENSNWNQKTRNLVFRGQKIQWTQLLSLQEWDQGSHRSAPGLQLVPKLTFEHLHLTPGLRMKVKLAAQVMSDTVANGLESLGKPGLSSTIHFIRYVNKFFDCLNVSSMMEGRNTRNENLLPYTSTNDPRFKEEFLTFLQEWSEEGKTVEGLSKKEQDRLCLSRQTLSGCFITVNSFVEVAKKLLCMEDVTYVLSDKLNQDPLEEFFGKQRAAGGHWDHPTVQQFGHSLLRNVVAGKRATGSAKGNITAKDKSESESVEPLPKRKRSTGPSCSSENQD